MSDGEVVLPGIDRGFVPLGVGTWAWGDESTWGMGGYDPDLTLESIRGAWTASLELGVTFFDTAEVYGGGESERIIGTLLAKTPGERPVIASKFIPLPQKLNLDSAMAASLEASLQRLGLDAIDLYQIHGPISLRSHKAMADALARQVSRGLVRAVGVSNYSAREMSSIHRHLSEHSIALATNQIEFSLLRTRPESTGLLRRCTELGVVPLAYSPLGQGRLTGKYSASNPVPGSRGFSAHPMELVDPIVDRLRSIGSEDSSPTPAQVALRWIIDKGAVPIPGAKNASQAEQNAGALGWSLSERDLSGLDEVSLGGTRTLKQRIWQHG